MSKVFLHQFKKNFWFNFILIFCWQIFIVFENGSFGSDNLWMLSCLYLIIFFRSLFSPKLLYWFRRSQILCPLNQAKKNPETTIFEMDCLITGIKYCSIPRIEEEDRLDLYPKDIEKLKRIVENEEKKCQKQQSNVRRTNGSL